MNLKKFKKNYFFPSYLDFTEFFKKFCYFYVKLKKVKEILND